MTGRELIKALLDGDAEELFDLDDEVCYPVHSSPVSFPVIQHVLTLRRQSTPTARPRTTIILSSTEEV